MVGGAVIVTKGPASLVHVRMEWHMSIKGFALEGTVVVFSEPCTLLRQFPGAFLIKCHKPSALNNGNVLSRSSGGHESEMRHQHSWVLPRAERESVRCLLLLFGWFAGDLGRSGRGLQWRGVPWCVDVSP